MVGYIRSEGLNCAHLAVPPTAHVTPPSGSGVLHTYCELSQINVTESVLKGLNNVVLNPLADIFERCKDTVKQALDYIAADLSHNGRRAMDTEQVFEPLDERVYDVGFNPSTGVCEELRQTIAEAVPHVLACLFHISPYILTQKGSTEGRYDVLIYPSADIEEALTDCLKQITCSFLPILTLDFGIPPRLNVSTNAAKEAAKELNTGA